MATHVLSRYERSYIVTGVNEDLRADGRSCRDYRHFSLGSGAVSNTSGSAKIQLGRTSAVVGVKAELAEPASSSPDAGRIEFFVDCSALASPEFERREGEDLGQHLAYQLAEAYRNDVCVDLSSLSVIPGRQCWVLYVDALVLQWGGGVLDALSVAVKAALHSTRLPKLTVIGEGDEMEIEVSDNPHDSTSVDASRAPVIITLNQVGNSFVVDATMEEECCSTSRLSVATNRQGYTLCVNKQGPGGIPYSKISDIITLAHDVAMEVLDRVDSYVQSSTTSAGIDTSQARVGLIS